ncbi:CHAT domain-containing protein, partial [Phormidium sp. CCY1219]|uniref:CHAT domain-containing protein n=1 Tax=Phormidium sp. CCY1219 TaxID=2886104 RepID=UPI002D1E691B
MIQPKFLTLFVLSLLLLVATQAPHPNARSPFGVLATAQTVEERKREADRLWQEGGDRYRQGQLREAIQAWEGALEIYRAINQRRDVALTLGNLGIAYRHLSHYTLAAQYLQEAVEIFREIGDRPAASNILGNLGLIYRNLEDYSRAAQYFQDALEIFREIGDREAEGSTLQNLGVTYTTLGDYRQAAEYFEQALGIKRSLGDEAGESNALGNLGIVYQNLANYTQAAQYFQEALALFRNMGNKAGESKVLMRLGTVYQTLAAYPQAAQSFQDSLAIFRQLGDKAGEGSALGYLGVVDLNRGEYVRAEQYLQQSLAIRRELEDMAGEGNVLNNLGNVYENLGAYAKALGHFQQALEIYRLLGDWAGEGNALNGVGNVYARLGEYAEAEEYFQNSLSVFRQSQDSVREAGTLNNLANVYQNQAAYEEAERYYQQSLAIYREIGDREGEGSALNGMGNIYARQGKYEEAERYYQDSLARSREVGDRAGVARTLSNLGNIYQNREAYTEAERYYQQALEIRRSLGDKAGESGTLNNLGVVYDAREDYEKAAEYFLASIEAFEQLRAGLTDAQKISLFERQKWTYELLQTALVAQNQTDTALEISERGRARAFVELLAQRLSDTPDTAATVTAPTIAQIKQIAAAQNATIVQYSYIREAFPVGNAKRLLESELYIWVIQPSGEIHFRRSDLKPLWQERDTSLDKLVGYARCFDNLACRSDIGVSEGWAGTTVVRSDRRGAAFNRQAAEENARPISPQQQRQWQELYQLLISPIADLLPTDPKEKVIFIPQGSLFLVPFPALQDENGTHLIEKHTLLTAPSIQVLDLTRQPRSQGNALIVGNPTMPFVGDPPEQLTVLLGAEKEARDIAQLLDVTPLLGSDATESAVVEQMRSSRLIHLATHGSFNSNRGIASWIALTPTSSDDGLLTAGEIFDMELNADLVVLSACETGR